MTTDTTSAPSGAAMSASSDSMTAALIKRLVDRRASVFDRLILRAMIRAAIDVTYEEHRIGDLTPEEHEDLLQHVVRAVRDALAMVKPH